MIKVGDKIYRNLEEQVQYLTNYHDVNQGIAQWGIRVVGQVESDSELPMPYDGEYGDAIAVGTQAPYSFYIWTRASIEGEPAYWFPFGEISIVGPKGPKGDKGDRGNTGYSTSWYYGVEDPDDTGDYVEGDMYLQKNGQVYRYDGNKWRSSTNIIGPQGPQGVRGPKGDQGEVGPVGPAGPQGDVGGFINIWGTLASVDQLPLPTVINNLSVGYLVEHVGGTDQSNDHYDLYIQVGSSPATAVWTNAGAFNAATLVTQGGVGLNVWDADTKLDKRTGASNYVVAYVKDKNGNQDGINIATTTLANSIVQRQSNAHIQVPSTPIATTDAASKNYVDLQASYRVQKVTSSTDENQVYGKTDAGVQYMFNVSRNALGTSIAQRTANGQIRVGNPSRADDAANKQYVDNATMSCVYEDFTSATEYKLQGDAYYMFYSDYANLSIRNADGSLVRGSIKQLQIMVATQAKYPTGAYKVCGMYWQGSGNPEGIRQAVSRGGYIDAPSGLSVCRLSKPIIEEA